MPSPLTSGYKSIAWVLVGVLITVVVAFTLYSFIGAIVIGIFLYYATRPVYYWLDERIDHPNVSATLTLLTVGGPILFILAYTALTGIQEADRFFAAADLQYFRTALEPYVDIVSGSEDQGLLGVLRNNISRVRGVATGALTWMLRLFVAFTLAFYLLRDDHKLADWFERTFENQPSAVTFMEKVDDDLTTIYTGNLLTIGVSGLLAVLVYYGLNLIAPAEAGIQFPILLGLLTGVATLIPSVGMKLVYVPYTAYLVWQSVSGAGGPIWFPVVFFVVTAAVVDVFPDIVIRSYLSKGDINMGLILLMYVLGAVAFGWYGVFLAPVILVVFIHFAQDILPALLKSDTTTV